MYKEKCGKHWNLTSLKPIPQLLLHSQSSVREAGSVKYFLSTCFMVRGRHVICSAQYSISRDLLWGFQERFSLLKRDRCGWCHLFPPHTHPSFLSALNVNVISGAVVAILWPWVQSMRLSMMEGKDRKGQGLWWHHSAGDPTSHLCLLTLWDK